MKNTVVYIDASNLKHGVEQADWKLDYKKFRGWLRDKFLATKVILFMGLVPENFELYNRLQTYGYEIQFRPTLTSKDGKTKGNVDGELILAIAEDFFDNKAESVVLVSGDGDYHCIVEFLKRKNVPVTIISPCRKNFSLLLKRTGVPIIILDEHKEKLKSNYKAPKTNQP